MRFPLMIALAFAALAAATGAAAQKMGVAPNAGEVKAQAEKTAPTPAKPKHATSHKRKGHTPASSAAKAQMNSGAKGEIAGTTTRPPAQTSGNLPTSNQEKPAY